MHVALAASSVTYEGVCTDTPSQPRTTALQSLVVDAPQQRAAMVAERGALVRMRLISVRNIDLEPLLHVLYVMGEDMVRGTDTIRRIEFEQTAFSLRVLSWVGSAPGHALMTASWQRLCITMKQTGKK